jgi:hypothetical protein
MLPLNAEDALNGSVTPSNLSSQGVSPKGDFQPALNNFINLLQTLINDYTAANYSNLSPDTIGYEEGSKYIRIVRIGKNSTSKSAHCFIEKETGNILKTASWKAPVKKNVRGNIFDADPLKGVTVYGAVYLRG